MPTSLLIYGPLVLAWAAFAALVALRRPGAGVVSPLIRVQAFIIAVAMTLSVPAVYAWVDVQTGVPNVSRLLVYSVAVAAGWVTQTLYGHLGTSPEEAWPRARRRAWPAVTAIGTMAVLHGAAGVDVSDPVNFGVRYGERWGVIGIELVVVVYGIWAHRDAIARSWGYARVAGLPPSTRLGMRLVAIGMGVGVVYALNRTAWALDPVLEVGMRGRDEGELADGLKGLFMAFALVGVTVPTWGPRVGMDRVCRWVGLYRDYLRGYGRWAALCARMPEIALRPPRGWVLDLLDTREIPERAYRQRIEIRDGLRRSGGREYRGGHPAGETAERA